MSKSVLIVCLLILMFTYSGFVSNGVQIPNKKYVLVIHGGAGAISKNLPEEEIDAIKDGISEALETGQEILKKGGTAIDAVEAVIRYLENNPHFNAGKGAVLTEEGLAELDASIMSGSDLSCGAVGNVKRVKNPITLARNVMEKSKHVLLVSDGAEKFAKETGLEMVESDYFITPEMKKNNKKRMKEIEEGKKGTVGAVALDLFGNLAAGTSTGGMMMKKSGRVGDSPIIGAGNYANNKTVAISCTGWGEKFIKNLIAYNVHALMEYKGYSLKQAVVGTFNDKLSKNDGGLISIDRDGNYYIHYNTMSMTRGVVTSEGRFEVKIWE